MVRKKNRKKMEKIRNEKKCKSMKNQWVRESGRRKKGKRIMTEMRVRMTDGAIKMLIQTR